MSDVSIETKVKSEIAAIKDRMVQIQMDIATLVASTDANNMTADKAQEFKRISEELMDLRTKLAFVMGQVR